MLSFNKCIVRKGCLSDFILQDRTTTRCSQARVQLCLNSATHLAATHALPQLPPVVFFLSVSLLLCSSALFPTLLFLQSGSCPKPSHQASANVVVVHSAQLTTLYPLTMSPNVSSKHLRT